MSKLLKLFVILLAAIVLLSIIGFLLDILVGLAAVTLKIVFIIAAFFIIYKGVQYVWQYMK